jgi:hypothetical protein
MSPHLKRVLCPPSPFHYDSWFVSCSWFYFIGDFSRVSFPSGKNMWRHHTTLNFDHTKKWCYHTIFGVNIHFFQHICLITPFDVWSHRLEYASYPSRVMELYIVDHTTRLADHTIDILFTPYVVHHTIYLESHQQGTIIPYLCGHTKTVWIIP